LHVAVDALGNALRVILSAGQVHDMNCAAELIAQLPAQVVVADKGYNSEALVKQIEASGAQAAIAPRANRRHRRTFDRLQYRCRNIIERFFSRIK
jgi:transposase